MTVERRFTLDSNILYYTADDDAGAKQVLARDLVARASLCRRCLLSVQSVGEFYQSITRKRLARPDAAARRARDFLELFPIVEPGAADVVLALDLAVAGRTSYWDGLLLATVARAGCIVFLSEGMQDGAIVAGVTIHNPLTGDALPAQVEALLA